MMISQPKELIRQLVEEFSQELSVLGDENLVDVMSNLNDVLSRICFAMNILNSTARNQELIERISQGSLLPRRLFQEGDTPPNFSPILRHPGAPSPNGLSDMYVSDDEVVYLGTRSQV